MPQKTIKLLRKLNQNEMERNLGKIYYDLKNPYSYGSIKNLYQEAKKKLKD